MILNEKIEKFNFSLLHGTVDPIISAIVRDQVSAQRAARYRAEIIRRDMKHAFTCPVCGELRPMRGAKGRTINGVHRRVCRECIRGGKNAI